MISSYAQFSQLVMDYSIHVFTYKNYEFTNFITFRSVISISHSHLLIAHVKYVTSTGIHIHLWNSLKYHPRKFNIFKWQKSYGAFICTMCIYQQRACAALNEVHIVHSHHHKFWNIIEFCNDMDLYMPINLSFLLDKKFVNS